MRAIKVPVAGALEIVEWSTLDDLAGLIGAEPGYVERVRVGTNASLAVHESGLLVGLPANPRAGLLYGTPIHGQPIVGDVVYAHEAFVEGGLDFVDMEDPGATMDLLRSLFDTLGTDLTD